VYSAVTEEYDMKTRRRFTGDFKARVAMEAMRGDKTIQEIAAKHRVHPNQVGAWKRQAIEGLSEVFSNGADRERQDRQVEIRDLHAKIGELTVERDFLSGGLKR
jgi:transposase